MSGFQESLNRRYLLVVVLISLLASFAVQLPALQSTLRTDSLNHNYDFLDDRSPFAGFTTFYYGHATYYRPVFELLYGLESILDFSPLLFRIVSIILASLFALLVARLTKELTQKTGLGLGAGIIVSFHPLIGLMILRPINQVTLLGMVLLLISVLTFLLQLRSTTKRNKYWLLSLSLIAALAAMLTKEIALPLPGVLFLIAFWETLRLKGTLVKAIKHSLKSILPFALVLGIYLLLRFNALDGLHLV
ncbi:phospholipid carrier-dependent glycosyltransferase, partial [bacterium]|nr:phospholipid carrier-dependent glycosyltransferase [bacterium]